MASLTLSDRQCAELESLVTHTPLAKERSRAQAVLWLAQGMSAEEITDLLVCPPPDGLQLGRAVPATGRSRPTGTVARWPRPGRSPTASEVIDPLIAELIDKDPREFGYHSTVWTAPLLMSHLKRAHGVDVSRRHIGPALERLRVRWKQPRHQLSLRPDTWRQSKGG